MNSVEMVEVSAPTAGIPVAEMMHHAARKGLLVDVRGGFYYVAINPQYSTATRVCRRVLALRVTICILAVAVTVFAVVGQLVHFIRGQYGESMYAVWYHRRLGNCWYDGYDRYVNVRKAFALLTAVFGLISLILAAVYAAAWARDERVRGEEEEANFKLQCAYGVEQVDVEDSSEMSFPFANTRLENRGQVAEVPIEEVERKRRKKDNDLGTALFSMLVMAAVCAVITMGFMADSSNFTFFCDDYKSRLDTGFALFVVALVLAVVAFILLAVPHLTRLYLCHMPPPRRCQLMLVDVNRPAANARGPGRVQDRLYAHAGLPAALPGPAPRATGREDPPPSLPSELERHRVLRSKDTADPPTRYVNVSGNYTTADYYTAPPPLFSVEPNDDAAKQKEEQVYWKQEDSHTRE